MNSYSVDFQEFARWTMDRILSGDPPSDEEIANWFDENAKTKKQQKNLTSEGQ